METESPKKEKRKRKSDGDGEELRKKKRKKETVQTAEPQGSLSGMTPQDRLEQSERPKEKKKHKEGRANGTAPAFERHDSPSEKIHKAQRAKEQPTTQGADGDDSMSSKGEKRKDKRKKWPSDATAGGPLNGIVTVDATQSTKRKERKRKIREGPETAEDAADEAQDEKGGISDDEHLEEELGQGKSYFAPANYVESSSGPKAFELITASLRVPIPPVGQPKPLASVCADSLSPMILRWDPVFKGIVIAYLNPRLTSNPVQLAGGDSIALAQAVDEYAAPFIWVRAEFIIVKPMRGVWLDGYVNLQNESFLGFVLWNAFTGTVERKRLPKDWIWIEDEEQEVDQEAGKAGKETGELVEFEMGGRRRKFSHSTGHFEDGGGNPVREEMVIRFRIWDFEPAFSDKDERHFLTLEGSMLTDEEEKALDEEERRAQQRTKSPRVPVTPRRSALRNSSQ